MDDKNKDPFSSLESIAFGENIKNIISLLQQMEKLPQSTDAQRSKCQALKKDAFESLKKLYVFAKNIDPKQYKEEDTAKAFKDGVNKSFAGIDSLQCRGDWEKAKDATAEPKPVEQPAVAVANSDKQPASSETHKPRSPSFTPLGQQKN